MITPVRSRKTPGVTASQDGFMVSSTLDSVLGGKEVNVRRTRSFRFVFLNFKQRIRWLSVVTSIYDCGENGRRLVMASVA